MKKTLLLIVVLFMGVSLFGSTDKYRLMFNDDPSTKITIGWNQINGSNPIVYYGTTDYGTNYSSYPNSKTVDRSVGYRGMNNRFARLSGLTPNTAYYFVIVDDNSVSQRYWFKTCPNVPTERLSFVAGGDSRNNRTPRQNANKIVSKLRPHAVLFGGDMTDSDNDSQWINWMDDWQYTIGTDNRMIPIVAARGNHESSGTVEKLFDIPSNEYYKITFGGSLISVYTLNSESSVSTQGTWLGNTLPSDNAAWKMAQYHRPIYPSNSGKSVQNDQFSAWVNHFYNYGVRFVVESDAHTIKTTWPVKPSGSSFVRDDNDPNSITFVGEGCWGAPLRSNNVSYSYTRDLPPVDDQVNWVFVDGCTIETRKVYVDNVSSVGTVSDNDIFTAPANLDIITTSNTPAGVITINQSCAPPVANFVASPTIINAGNTVNFTDLSSNNPNSWNWTFNGGTPSVSNDQNPSITYSTPGTYSVTLTASNASGNDTETKTGYITVNANNNPPVADFTANNTNIMVGGTVNFSDLSSNVPTSWSWSFPGGSPSSSSDQNPSVTYNTQGTYQVVLTATNSYGNDTETKTGYITVANMASIDVSIANGNDDVEENQTNGSVYTNSSDLEFMYDTYNSQNHQTVGLRFQGVSIPQGAIITNAYVQFTCDEATSGAITINIKGHDSNNSGSFGGAYDLSNRTKTSASVSWNPANWNTVGESGVNQKTSDISSIVQEIVNRSGWNSGAAMSFFFTNNGSDTDKRTADSYEGNNPATLHIDYQIQPNNDPPNSAPVVSVTNPSNGTVYNSLGQLSIQANASDSDGNVSQVEFFVNGASVGVDNSSPYAINWTIPAWGGYNIYAIATDNDNASTTSSTISISAVEPNGCTTEEIDFNNFESGWGIWNDGGSDCRRSSNDASYALGNYCVRIRDNSSSSYTRTDNLDLASYDELTIDFSFYPRALETGEDFWLQISTNGGSSYTTIGDWNRGAEFNNGQRYYESVDVSGPFTSNTRLRFVCDASSNSDYIYLDEIKLTGCNNNRAMSQNMTSQQISKDPSSEQNSVGLEQLLNLDEILIYPNPTDGMLNLEGLTEEGMISVYNVNGALVFQNQYKPQSNGKVTIDVTLFNSGIYMIHILQGDQLITKKFVKQ